ncbi:hypothetical protein SCLCIDRAFT_1215978 [Scleroderma citrinum Foug A]|uniref:Hydrophobin n=1 Tax=Scleroderma citrinum Foug A TaxID=1036808 RepID=A0A0C3A9F1_9AGAM|nr:hypothetical protein SCLCIDRAFT_1215978 [Scleroderma citrinum Foug A]
MFIRASGLLVPIVALSSMVAAAPGPVARTDGSCSNGTLQCCQSTSTATSSSLSELTGLLGIVADIPLVGPLLGLNCSPITVIGLGSGANCAQQTVCCQNDQFSGLINVGCTNLNLGL